MRRSFASEPIDPRQLSDLLDLARRAPSAGNAQGLSWLVFEGAEQTGRYWAVAMPTGRDRFAFPGLFNAPVLVVALVDAEAYVARYAEADKIASGLGRRAQDWPVPYWFVDGGMAVQTLRIAAHEAGLASCFFGLFDRERTVLDAFGVPQQLRAVGTVAIGHVTNDARLGRSAGRPRRSDVIHRGSW